MRKRITLFTWFESIFRGDHFRSALGSFVRRYLRVGFAIAKMIGSRLMRRTSSALKIQGRDADENVRTAYRIRERSFPTVGLSRSASSVVGVEARVSGETIPRLSKQDVPHAHPAGS